MSAILSPIESEFATVDDAQAYELWFLAQVHASLDDPRPSAPHDEVMAEMDQIIVEAERQQRQFLTSTFATISVDR